MITTSSSGRANLFEVLDETEARGGSDGVSRVASVVETSGLAEHWWWPPERNTSGSSTLMLATWRTSSRRKRFKQGPQVSFNASVSESRDRPAQSCLKKLWQVRTKHCHSFSWPVILFFSINVRKILRLILSIIGIYLGKVKVLL